MQKRDFETYQKRFRDFEILPKFSETHVFRGTIRHPYLSKSTPKINLTIRSCRAPVLALCCNDFASSETSNLMRSFRILVMENLLFLRNYNML